jgi:hypothetical protein
MEKRFIDEPDNRNLLTGNNGFIVEIEQRIGIRIDRRGRGRLGNEDQ